MKNAKENNGKTFRSLQKMNAVGFQCTIAV
jgi:hypothetical protein